MKATSFFKAGIFAIFVLFLSSQVAFATEVPNDNCDEVFTYTKTEHHHDSRLIIDFSDDRNSISLSTKPTYEVIKVELDLVNDGVDGFQTHATSAVTGYNPTPGDEITAVRVEVKKNCERPTPSPTPSPTPEVTPSPTPTPAPGKSSGLEITALSCTNRNFDVVIDLKDNQTPAAGVKVKFTYNGKVITSTTDSEGKARAGFHYEGDMSVKVEPENGFAQHNRHVELPKNETCQPGVGGQTHGEVLGTSTMAETGVLTDFLIKSVGSFGGILTSIGSVLYAKKKRS